MKLREMLERKVHSDIIGPVWKIQWKIITIIFISLSILRWYLK